ncbi:MAG: hypothetical protein WCS20_04010 [Alphaproteobacteria bacterium]
MFGTLKTLIQGQNARAEERLRAAHAVELIDKKDCAGRDRAPNRRNCPSPA